MICADQYQAVQRQVSHPCTAVHLYPCLTVQTFRGLDEERLEGSTELGVDWHPHADRQERPRNIRRESEKARDRESDTGLGNSRNRTAVAIFAWMDTPCPDSACQKRPKDSDVGIRSKSIEKGGRMEKRKPRERVMYRAPRRD